VEFTTALIQRGLDEETVRKVLGGNFLRVFGEVWG
jgi:microsomal dipeptidase-like Zn-dependent dipeptidase